MRAIILVGVDTDQVPGWGYDPQDYVNHIQSYLDKTIGHYKPTVKLVDSEHFDKWLESNMRFLEPHEEHLNLGNINRGGD